jgi:hypothetical protein
MTTASPFRSLPFMGVIRVNNEAMTKHGWKMGDPAWTNLRPGHARGRRHSGRTGTLQPDQP